MIRIPIADDHEGVRRGLKNPLASQGWDECAEAASGDEAIARAEAYRPDVAILDATMPPGDGLALPPRARPRPGAAASVGGWAKGG